MALPHEEIISLSRSAAMEQPGGKVAISREHLIELCDELLELRSLVARVGSDLRTMAQASRNSGGA